MSLFRREVKVFNLSFPDNLLNLKAELGSFRTAMSCPLRRDAGKLRSSDSAFDLAV